MYRYDYPNMCGIIGGGFGAGWILMLIFWGVVIWAIFVLVKHFTEKNYHWNDEKEEEATRILKERYARGEISKEEFEERKNILANKK
ncbi:MAG: hypothetical protein ACD_56C00141G0014 [uncultured bacterium]|nr:MAG: hypothetical protein ACD_56C00141G0014 [uncultured bacterium]